MTIIRNRRMLAAVIAASLLAALAALVFTTIGDANSPVQGPPRSTFSVGQARTLSDREVYFAGDSVDGVPLAAVLRRTGTADFVSFIYGDCVATADRGCAPPAEVQVWRACKRNLALYDSKNPGTPTPDPTTVRGAPAAFFEDGLRLEIHTGKSLVVVFSDSRDRVEGIAKALEGLNVSVSRDDPLPEPAAGAVAGKLSC